MKNSDIETLGKVALALKEYLPIGEIKLSVGEVNITLTVENAPEHDLYNEFLSVYEGLKVKNDKRNKGYQEKAEYHREATRKWRQENKERYKAYQKEWSKNKKKRKPMNYPKKLIKTLKGCLRPKSLTAFWRF